MEKDETAANAFKLNYPSCTVLTDDCNLILRLAMDVRQSLYKRAESEDRTDETVSLSSSRAMRLTHPGRVCQRGGKWNFCAGGPPARGSVE